MNTEFLIEILGYVSSVLILVSFMMKEPLKLRMVGLLGASLFCIYGFCIHSYPTAVMNLGVSLVNAYYLIKMRKEKEKEDKYFLKTNLT